MQYLKVATNGTSTLSKLRIFLSIQLAPLNIKSSVRHCFDCISIVNLMHRLEVHSFKPASMVNLQSA